MRYSLAYGSLLGAVRHKGFIPWDDDIDIMMLREDYEEFIHSYKSEKFMISCHDFDKNVYTPFAKIYDPRTILQENVCYNTPFGANIDIFPIDNMPKSSLEIEEMCKKKQRWNHLYVFKIMKINKDWSFMKKIFMKSVQLILAPLPMSFFMDRMVGPTLPYRNIETEKAGVFVTADNKAKWIVPKYYFAEYIDVSFEGRLFRCIKEYDLYLKAVYGNYMQLPPVEQRVTHHGFNAYWK